jgi:opacity protein-like surface antigen
MVRKILVVTVLASLAAAPAAQAKEVQAVQVCGAADCFTFDRGNAGGKLELLAELGPAAEAPPQAAGWYRLRTRIGGHGMKPVAFTNAYVPSANLIRVDDEGGGGYAWYEVNADVRPVLRNVASRLAPRPAASLHVNDIAPGVPGPTPTRAAEQPRESGAGNAWLFVVLAVAAGSATLLAVRARRG